MNIYKNKLFLACIMPVLASILVSCLYSDSIFAHTATLTTASSISLDALPQHDGISIDEESINVTTTCHAGYNLSVATSTSPDLYLNGDGTSTATFTAVDGTSTLANSTNKWGYSMTANASSSTIFSPLSTTASVLKTPSQTFSQTDIDDTFSIYYGTKVASSVTPGSYQMADSGAIVYYLTVEPTCLLYTVQYQDNGADNPNGMGTTDASTGEKSVKQINIAEDTKITLLPSNFKRAGFGFLGWSTDQNAYAHFTDNDNTNDPVIYGPMEDVVIDSTIIATATSRNQINMYAVWVPALKDGSNNTVYFQDWDNPNTNLPHDGCSTLTATTFDNTITDEKGKIIVAKDSFTALTDKRDNMVYAVAKLADGNCWMTENLRLEHQYTMGQNQNDSNVTNQYLSQGYGGTTGTYGNFLGLAEPESTNFKYSTAPNTIYKSSATSPTDTYDGNGTLEDIGSTNNPGYRFPRYNNNSTLSLVDSTTYTQNYINASSPSNSGINYPTSSNIYSYGNYYTWADAMANTNYYDANSSNSEAAGTSLCPSNWHLPSSNGTAKEYGTLSRSYGGTGNGQSGATNAGDTISNRFRSFPNNYIYSGSFIDSSISNRGSYGYYWSRSSYSYNGSYGLSVYSTGLAPSGSNIYYYAKHFGFSVRCLIGASDVEITLDSNNGTGAISRVYGSAGSTITLPSSSNPSASIAQPGYAFKNWNTAPNGSGTSYTSSYSIPAGSTGVTLHAQWTPQYTITYIDNCMSWASSDANCTATASADTSEQRINLANNPSAGTETGTLAAYNKWTLTGWKIKEWTTNADGTGTAYPVSSTYTVPSGAGAGDGITLYAHWVPIYTIQYDGNNADNPNGMGTTNATTGVKSVAQTNVGEGDPVTLLASNFKKTGNGFAGWSTDSDAWTHFTDNDSTNDPIIYGPMESISAPAYPTNGTNITTMYAVWVPAEKDGSNNPIYLQEWDDPTDPTDACAALTSTTFNGTTGEITASKNGIIALTDKRDDEVYTIAKLADDNCWMIENLRLEAAGTIGNNKNDGNVTNQSLAQGYGGTTGTYGNFVGLAASESTNFVDSTTSNSIYESSANPPVDTYDPANNVLEDIGTTDYPNFRFPRYNNSNNASALASPTFTENYANAASPSTSGTYINSTISSYGNYYTWAAAMANTNYYTSPSTSEAANTSICPSGWHLPSSNGTAKEYGLLSQRYGGSGSDQSGVGTGDIMSNRFRSFPNNFLYSGFYWRGWFGRYWSRSALSYGGSYYLYLTSTSLNPSNSSNKNDGKSVRCLIGS